MQCRNLCDAVQLASECLARSVVRNHKIPVKCGVMYVESRLRSLKGPFLLPCPRVGACRASIGSGNIARPENLNRMRSNNNIVQQFFASLGISFWFRIPPFPVLDSELALDLQQGQGFVSEWRR
jgi:hypothetical protein